MNQTRVFLATHPRMNSLWLLLVPTGLLGYMYFLYKVTGNPFAFKDIMVVWGRHPTFFLSTLLHYVKEPLLFASGWDFRLLNFAALMIAIVCGAVLIKWRWWSMACYTLASLFVMLTSGVLQSQARYVMALFPVFIVLGRLCRSPRLQVILTTSLILLCITTILFCYEISFVLS